MRQTAQQRGSGRKIRGQLKRLLYFAYVMLTAETLLVGCTVRIDRTNKIGNPEFTVLDKDMIPEEMAQMIDAQKEKPFRLTYTDKGVLYIAEGYGRQPETGYSVEVVEVYETRDAICFVTNLMGPQKGEEIKEIATFPYVVVMLEDIGKEVVFD